MSENLKILGFDIGISSIGWAFVENNNLKDCGVRIFTKAEDKDGASLALPRREARGVRRRLARRKNRLNELKRLICAEFKLNLAHYKSDDGILPKAYETNKDTKSPYELRTLALKQRLTPQELARVILHIAKHRGYGNKHAKSAGKDEGVIKKAIAHNEAMIKDKNYQSVGQYLYEEFFEQNKAVRNKAGAYEHCIAQDSLKAELELILKRQKELGTSFSPEFEGKILEIAFFQRPLKSFANKVGFCVFYEQERRASKDSLSAVEFIALTRIINTLKSLESKLGIVYSADKIAEILAVVLDKGELSYKGLRGLLNLPQSVHFAKDSKLDYSKGAEAEKAKFVEFKKLKAFKKALGGDFARLDRCVLDELATKIALINDKQELLNALQSYPLKQEQRQALSELDFSQFINLSFKALGEILPLMKEGLRYDEAVEKAELKEYVKYKGKSGFLPPLIKYEPNLANPVVARVLSEYRKVLNALLKKYGKVHKIHIELARDVGKSFKDREKIKKEQSKNFDKNEEARKLCEQILLKPSSTNILKCKLWLEQGEFCAYSQAKITIDDLKDSNMLQIDHIYPYSRSFDDSYMNKVLVFSKENQIKLNKTPFEAFGSDEIKWEQIKTFSQKLPLKKRQRIYNTNFKDKESGFKDRNLNDTGYIARLVANWTKNSLEFLKLDENECTISGEKGSKVHIEAISGSLTAVMRHYWGLGSKDRNNHIHHATDAIIIAFCQPKIIKAFSDFKKLEEQNKAKFYAKQIEKLEFEKQIKFFEPFKNFRQQVLVKLDEIFVSKPPRKRARGALHEETFYSFDDKTLLKNYGGKQGVQKALELGKIRQIGTKIVSNGAMVRVDIFKDKKGKFYGVPIYTMDFALGVLPNKAVVSGKDKNGVIKDWLLMDENYEFCFSLHKDDLILVQKREMSEPCLCYFVGFVSSNAQINVAKHDNKFENLKADEKLLFSNATPKEVVGKSIGIQNLKVFEKYKVSPLGEVKKADFEARQNISLKTSPKRNKKEKQ